MLRRILSIYNKVLVGAMTTLLMILTVVVSYQVFSRYVDFVPRYLWTEEVSRFCFIWVVFLGAAIAVKEGTHFTIDILPDSVPSGLRWAIEVLVLALVAVIGFVMVAGGLRFTSIGIDRISTTSGIRLAWVYAAVPVAGLSILLFVVEKFVGIARGEHARLGSREGLEPEEGS